METVTSTPESPPVTGKGRVLIIDNNPERANSLIDILKASRYKVAVPMRLQEGVAEQVALIKPDIILIGVDFPGREILSWVASLHESYPCPTVMFSRDERSETIQAATRAGVSAYAVGKLTGARVKTIIEAAVARFYEFRALQEELEKTKTNLAERKIIERAKELVAQQRGCNEAQAYQILRKMAMNRRKRLAEVSQDILSVAEVLTNKL